MELHKSLPFSEELERVALTAAVSFADERAVACSMLSPADFYVTVHAEVFAAIGKLAKQNAPCDELVLRDVLRDNANALALLDGLGVRIHPNIDGVCERLRALSQARSITRAALEVAARGVASAADPDGFLEDASARITSALMNRDSRARIRSLGDLCTDLIELYDQNKPAKGFSGLSTGLAKLDGMLGGLEPGRLYVVAGRPGMGKSALAVQMAYEAARAGAAGAVFSLEMPDSELATRMACSAARIDSRALARREVDGFSMKRLTTVMGKLAELPLSIVEAAGMNCERICLSARQMKLKSGLGLVVVDYLQLIRSSRRHDSREQEVSEISRQLKLLARELELPVIAVSQLNRDVEKRADKRPLMSDLRESGAIEQDADVIAMLYREDYYDQKAAPGLCQVIVDKNRGGPTGYVVVKFEAEYTRFSNL